ncbi:MAG: universal stress protein, partial [Nodosilinea sp.]
SPGRVICTLAKTWAADLIVVGSHRRKGLSELFLGSVSNYVMHHAPCSVLVVDAQTLSEATVEAASLTTAKGP